MNVAQEVGEVEAWLDTHAVSKALWINLVLFHSETHDALVTPSSRAAARIFPRWVLRLSDHLSFDLTQDLFKCAFEVGSGSFRRLKSWGR